MNQTNSQQALIAAIRRGDAAAIQQALGNGANVNLALHRYNKGCQRDEYDLPLAVAVEEGKSSIVRLLLEAGADVNLDIPSDKHVMQELLLSKAMYSPDITAQLLQAGIDPNKRDNFREPALMHDFITPDFEWVEQLLKAGARTNVHGLPNRYLPKEQQPYEIPRSLYDMWNKRAESKNDTEALAVFSLLKKHGMVTNGLLDIESSELSPEDAELMRAVLHNDIKRTEQALANGGHADATDWGGVTCLVQAAKHQNAALCRLLLHHCKPNETDRLRALIICLHGSTEPTEIFNYLMNTLPHPHPWPPQLLYRAAKLGYTGIISSLVEAGADVNAAYGDEYPLHVATRYDRPAAVQLLLELGANPNHFNKSFDNETALFDAARNEYDDIAVMLIIFGCDAALLDIEARAAWEYVPHRGELRELLKREAEKSSTRLQDEYNRIFRLIVQTGDSYTTLRRFLLKDMVDVNLPFVPENIIEANGTDTPLCCAARRGDALYASWLVWAGADIHARGIDGRTAEEIARDSDNDELKKAVLGTE